MTRSSLEVGDGDGHRVLGPSLVNCRQNATLWPLCPNNERAKDGQGLSIERVKKLNNDFTDNQKYL